MAILKIHEYGDPILKVNSSEVETVTEQERELIKDMIETMYDAPGVGLAAPQVGVNKRIIVIDKDPANKDKQEALALINPVIVEFSDDQAILEEGCLSIPEFKGEVKRCRFVKVRALNTEGELFEIEGTEMQSRILQHEVDHLDGILFVDRMAVLKRDIAKRKLKKRFIKGEFASAARS